MACSLDFHAFFSFAKANVFVSSKASALSKIMDPLSRLSTMPFLACQSFLPGLCSERTGKGTRAAHNEHIKAHKRQRCRKRKGVNLRSYSTVVRPLRLIQICRQ